MKILVTGGAGFIGSHLVDALVELGHDVRILDNLDGQVHRGCRPPEYLNPEAEFIEGSVCNISDVVQALHNVEVVYHLAAAVGVRQSMDRPFYYTHVNCCGTSTILEELLRMRTAPRLIVASSMSVYGEGICSPKGPLPTSERLVPQPQSVYALTKLVQEQSCIQFGLAHGLPVVALRYFNVYGPRQALHNPYTGVAANFINWLRKGESPIIYEDGMQVRDFTHVRDITQANILALHYDGVPLAINVGTGKPTTVAELALALAKEINPGIEPTVTQVYRSGDIRHCYADIARARELLAYEPTVEFHDGIREYARQYTDRD